MLGIMQMKIGGFDLLRGYPRFELVVLIKQRGDLPCIGADVDVVEAEAEENVVRQILARFVTQ